MSENEDPQDGRTEPGFSFSDKRRVDPETGEVRKPEGVQGNEAQPDPVAQPSAPGTPPDSGEAGDTDEQTAASADASDLGIDIPDDASGLDAEPSEDAKRAAEALNDLQRLNAEYAAYRMRASREQERAKDSGVIAVAEALIPLLDEVRLAQENGDVTGPFEVHVAKLFDVLEKVGIVQYGEVGEEFDPTYHEALMQQPSEEAEGPTIFMVMQPGYRLGERVIRAARVGVQQPAD